MQWQLTEPHYIDERVLPAGTIVGDDTPYPWRSNHNDPKIGRKKGDHMPPTTAMRPLDDEAHKAHEATFHGVEPLADPTHSIPLTSGPESPLVPGQAAPPAKAQQTPVNPKPAEPVKPLAGHDSAKNPGDSKDTETAKAPDIKKL